ncbi:MAG: T9SS type A sorting domain-containing protein [Flavobacteriales bacterium]|nr:T9SS type A sorting domain-containing protein [Flavobacteriales bacterium]
MYKLFITVGSMALLCFNLAGQVVLIDQTGGQQGASIVAQDFEFAYEAYSSYAAEDVIVPTGEQWHLDSILLIGEYQTPSGTPTPGSGIVISIHSDNAGVPGSILFSDSTNSGADPGLDGTLKYVWQESMVLNPGTYWIVAAARKDYASTQTQWQWFSSSATEGDTALWVNPGGGFTLNNCPNWTEVTTCYGSTYPGVSFKLFGCPGPKPAILGLPNDTGFCSNSELSLTASSSLSSVDYLWSNGDSGPTVTITDSGLYTVTVTDTLLGCSSIDTVSVHVMAAPDPLLEDTTVCEGETLQIPGNGCLACGYTWSDGSASDTLQIVAGGGYWLLALDTVNGCAAVDSFDVVLMTIAPIQFNSDSPYGICPGASLDLSITNDYQAYLWSTGSTSDAETIVESGWVTISVTASNGCSRMDSIWVMDFPAPDPTIEVDFAAGMWVLACPGFNTYLWSNGSDDPTIEVTGGVVSVTVTDSNGCQASDTTDLSVGMDETETKGFQLIPNPAYDVVVLSKNSAFESAVLSLITVDGKVILQEPISGQNTHRIDLSSLPPGLYHVTVSDRRNTFTQTLIKVE